MKKRFIFCIEGVRNPDLSGCGLSGCCTLRNPDFSGCGIWRNPDLHIQCEKFKLRNPDLSRNPDKSGFGSVQHPDKSRFAVRMCRFCRVCEIRMTNPDFHVEREKYGSRNPDKSGCCTLPNPDLSGCGIPTKLRNPDRSECEIRINPDVALCQIRIFPDAESG